MTDSAIALSYESPQLHGRLDAGVGEALGVAHRQVLRVTIAVTDQIIGAGAAAVVDRLLERVKHEVGDQGDGDSPSDAAGARRHR